MTQLFTASAADRAILQGLVEAEVQRQINRAQRPPTEHAWSEGEDHQAPEVYAGLAPTGGIPGWTGILPGVATCELFRIQSSIDPAELAEIEGFQRPVYNISPLAVSAGSYFPAIRTKGGPWIAGDNQGLVRCCLAEDHPGYAERFTAYRGTWDKTTGAWSYGATVDDATLVTCIDWWNSDDGPYPEMSATGLFLPRPSDVSGDLGGVLYEAVTMDCDCPGGCFGATCTGTGTGTS